MNITRLTSTDLILLRQPGNIVAEFIIKYNPSTQEMSCHINMSAHAFQIPTAVNASNINVLPNTVIPI
jgi:hypothetical protein